jgi:Ca2+-binding RTX toxin-like protein
VIFITCNGGVVDVATVSLTPFPTRTPVSLGPLPVPCDSITNVVVDSGDGFDHVEAQQIPFTFATPPSVTVDGGAGNDLLVGAGDETLRGGAGDDLFSVQLSAPGTTTTVEASLIDGDFVNVDGTDGADTMTLRGTDTVDLTSPGSPATPARLVLSNLASTVRGFAPALNLAARNGDDTVDASGSIRPVSLDGGSGTNTLVGGPFADFVASFEGATDDADGGSGDDVYETSAGVFSGVFGQMTVHDSGPSTDDRLDLGGFTFGLAAIPSTIIFTSTTATVNTHVVATFSGIEHLLADAGQAADTIDASAATLPVTLFGNGGDDALTGGSGNDLLDGGPGDDTLKGGAGDDEYPLNDIRLILLFTGADTIDDSAGGSDTVNLLGVTEPATIDMTTTARQQVTAHDSLAMSGVEDVIGSEFSDMITLGPSTFADGAAADDHYRIGIDSLSNVSPTVDDSGTTGVDGLAVTGTSAADAATIYTNEITSPAGAVFYSGLESVGVDLAAGGDSYTAHFTALGGPATPPANVHLQDTGADAAIDMLTVDCLAGATLGASSVSANGVVIDWSGIEQANGCPPTLAIAAVASPTKQASITFTVSRADTVTCRVDGGTAAACASPFTPTGLADGTHTLVVRAANVQGAVEQSTSWTVDTVAPSVTISAAPSGTVAVADASVAFTAGEAAAFTCSLDGAAPTSCTSPVSYTGLANGTHTVTVAATDAAGNTGTVSATWTVSVAPPLTAPTGPPGSAGAVIRHDAAGSVTVAAPTSGGPTTQVTVQWAPGMLASDATILVTPAPVATPPPGFQAGGAVVQVTVQAANGTPITSVDTPLEIVFANAPADVQPASSADGVIWTLIPQVAGPALPLGQRDGWYRDATGAIHILTRHLTYFGVLVPAAKVSVSVQAPARLDLRRSRNLPVTVTATTAGQATISLVSQRRKTVARARIRVGAGVTHVTLRVPKTARNGRYTLVTVLATPTGSATQRRRVVVTGGRR